MAPKVTVVDDDDDDNDVVERRKTGHKKGATQASLKASHLPFSPLSSERKVTLSNPRDYENYEDDNDTYGHERNHNPGDDDPDFEVSSTTACLSFNAKSVKSVFSLLLISFTARQRDQKTTTKVRFISLHSCFVDYYDWNSELMTSSSLFLPRMLFL